MKKVRTVIWSALSIALLCVVTNADPNPAKNDEVTERQEVVALTLIDYDRATGKFELRIDNVSDEPIFVDIVQLKSPGVTAGNAGNSASVGGDDVPLHEALYARLGSRRRVPGFESYRVLTGTLSLPEKEKGQFVGADAFVLHFAIRGWNESGDRFFRFSKDIEVHKTGDGP